MTKAKKAKLRGLLKDMAVENIAEAKKYLDKDDTWAMVHLKAALECVTMMRNQE